MADLWSSDGAPIRKMAPCPRCGADELGSYFSAGWCSYCGMRCILSEDMFVRERGSAPPLHISGGRVVGVVPPAPVDSKAALASLRALVDIIERTGGYMTPADQESLRTARGVIAKAGAP